MSNTPDMSSFGKFIPGFEFLQSMSKQGASDATNAPSSAMPNLGSWIAPTLNEEELTKRIDELKAVSFWLDQNAAALKATIQALEVQKMTLATLKNMNFSFGAAPASASTSAPASASSDDSGDDKKTEKTAKNEAGKADALQWWNALTQQFGAIASKTMQDAAAKAAETIDKTQATSETKSPTKNPTKAAVKSPAKTVKPKSKAVVATKTKPASK